MSSKMPCLPVAVPAYERTAKRTARRSLRSLCVPESSEHPRNAANAAPRASAFSRVFARIRWCSGVTNQSGRTVRIGFAMGFSGLLRSLCGPKSRAVPALRRRLPRLRSSTWDRRWPRETSCEPCSHEWRTLHEPRAFELASSESLHNQRRLFGAPLRYGPPRSVDVLEFRGMARVVVDGRYSYETDLDLEVGDEVLLPPSGLGGQWVARVTALSSDYTGPCRRILGLVHRRIDAERQDAALAAVPITGFRAGTTFEVTASCGHQVLLHIEGVNRAGRPTHVRYTCQTWVASHFPGEFAGA
jgi:hypothetical protein